MEDFGFDCKEIHEHEIKHRLSNLQLLLLLLHFRLMKRSNLSNNVAGQEAKLEATKENLV